MSIWKTTLRLNLEKEAHLRAWTYLKGADLDKQRSINETIVTAVNDYFDHMQRQDETQNEIESISADITKAVERKLSETLPAFLAGYQLASGRNIPVEERISYEKEISAEDALRHEIDTDIDWDFLNGC